MPPDQPPAGVNLWPKGSGARRLWGTLLLALVVPVLVYFVARLISGDATTALGCPAAAELLVSLVRTGIKTQRSSWAIPLALTAIASFGGALALTVAFHGAPLPFEPARPAYSGIVGLVFLVSAAVGRPVGGSLIRRRTDNTDEPAKPPSKRM